VTAQRSDRQAEGKREELLYLEEMDEKDQTAIREDFFSRAPRARKKRMR
jgi:hypothetical protein